jgi:gas vesicle protein
LLNHLIGILNGLKMKNYGNILFAFLAGTTAGIVVGVLFAPYKGSDTRRRIVDSSVHLAEEGMSALQELKDKYLKTISGNGGAGHHIHN